MSIKVFWLEPTGERAVHTDPPTIVESGGEPLYRRSDTGEVVFLYDAPVGAMWDAAWMALGGVRTGPDGITLVVRTPGGDWLVDSEASNCTRTQWGVPADGGPGREWKGRTHYCWVRHGDPRKPETLHVDKNGNTCSAGAGSIQCGSYHGFLHHGELT